MNPDAFARVRSSFDLVAPKGRDLLKAFYDALAATAPETRALFPSDAAAHASLMIEAVGLVAKHVDRPEGMVEPLNKLCGKRVKFGAKAQHVPAIREALLSALADATDPVWTPQLAADWSSAIDAAAKVVTHPGHAQSHPAKKPPEAKAA